MESVWYEVPDQRQIDSFEKFAYAIRSTIFTIENISPKLHWFEKSADAICSALFTVENISCWLHSFDKSADAILSTLFTIENSFRQCLKDLNTPNYCTARAPT